METAREAAPRRLIYPIPEARQLLGGIGHTKFYDEVKAGRIRLVKIGKRSFVSYTELKRIAGVAPNALNQADPAAA